MSLVVSGLRRIFRRKKKTQKNGGQLGGQYVSSPNVHINEE